MKDNKLAVCVKKDNGLYEELIISFYQKTCELNSGLDERDLWLHENKTNKEFPVSQEFFDCLFDALKTIYKGSIYVENVNYEERQRQWKERNRKGKRRTLLTRKQIKKAINWEVSEKELDKYVSDEDYRYEKGDYCDFDLIIEKFHSFMRGKKGVSYVSLWSILLMRCFYEAIPERSRKIKEVYQEIADFFDCFAFMDECASKTEKRKTCKAAIALIKHFRHKVENIRNGKNDEFTKNNVVTYVNFRNSLNNGTDCLYNVCVADLKNKTINYMIVPEFEYDEEINYTFLNEEEFNELPSDYYRFKFNSSMSKDYSLNPL